MLKVDIFDELKGRSNRARYLIQIDYNNMRSVNISEVTTANAAAVRGTMQTSQGQGFDLPNGTSIFIERALIDKWSREFVERDA
jgi:hypothetical protein